MFQLMRGGKGAERRRNPTGQRGAEHGRQELRPVGHQDADPLALAQAAGDQGPRHFHRTVPQVAVGPALHRTVGTTLHQRFPVRETLRHLADEAGQGQLAQPRLLRQQRTPNDRDRLVLNELMTAHRRRPDPFGRVEA